MKVLLVNNHHYLMGGAHKVYLETGKLLEAYGHEVYYFSQKNNKNIYNKYSECWPDEVNYRNLSKFEKLILFKNFIYNDQAYLKLIDFIDLIKPDIAHIHLFMGGLTSSILKALKEKNIPIVHTAHDYRLICPAYTLFDKNNKLCERCKDKNYLRCTLRNCALDLKLASSFMLSLDAYFRNTFIKSIDNIDHFIFVSNFSRNKHIMFNPQFINKSDILYNFSEVNYINPDTTKDYFLYFGRISREKGLQNIVTVFNEMELPLYIVGEGKELAALKKRSKCNIKYLGYKKDKELFSLISAAKFVILPSLMHENNPLSIIEAFGLNKPVIGSSRGGIPELLENNRGFTFCPDNLDELKEVITKAASLLNDEYIFMQKQIAKFYSGQLTKEQHYNKLLKIYQNTIKI